MTRYVRRASIFSLVCVALLFASSMSHATNGHQLSAIGAYQQGMGGAVTAAPYDATTAISNPAGMAMIGNRTDFSFEAFMPKRSAVFIKDDPTDNGSPFYLVPAVGWTAPVNDRGDLFFGGGMYGVSGMGVDYSTHEAPIYGAGAVIDLYSQYQFWKMAPTLAWKTGNVALGFALNLDYQAFAFKQIISGPGFSMGMDLSEMQSAVGGGASVGLIYQPVPAFALGLMYSSKQFFTPFKWRLAAGDIVAPDPITGDMYMNTGGEYTMTMNFPQQAAMGIAVRLGRPVLWTVDVKWINYSATHDVIKLKGSYAGGLTDLPMYFGWSDVYVAATGLQFDITPNFVFRLGYNYSTSPIKPEDVENNMVFPAIVTSRASGGFTYRFGRHWEMTMAYMKAFEAEMKIKGNDVPMITLEEQAVDFEVSYRF